MMAQPLKACLDSVMSSSSAAAAASSTCRPRAGPSQEEAKRLVREYDHLVLVCGHYEGVDERFIQECVDEELSLGDFVLTGGEIAAMAVTDAVCRLVPGVLSDEECYTGESHWEGLLEYPQYTRPEVWQGRTVPEVLRSGVDRTSAAGGAGRCWSGRWTKTGPVGEICAGDPGGPGAGGGDSEGTPSGSAASGVGLPARPGGGSSGPAGNGWAGPEIFRRTGAGAVADGVSRAGRISKRISAGGRAGCSRRTGCRQAISASAAGRRRRTLSCRGSGSPAPGPMSPPPDDDRGRVRGGAGRGGAVPGRRTWRRVGLRRDPGGYPSGKPAPC